MPQITDETSGPYHAEFYDLVIPGSFQGDLEWYRALARASGGPVLELGAGSGRITIPIAEDGLEIHALDADRGMLTALRRKVSACPHDVQHRIVGVEDDMRSFHLPIVFALVIIPFRAFLHNVTDDDQMACLRRAYEHLKPGGTIALNVFHPSLEYMAQQAGALAGVWRWSATQATPDGGCVVRSDATRYDTARQRVHSVLRFEHFDADSVLRRTFLQRLELSYLYPADLRSLLDRAGFTDVRIAGGFDGRPFARDGDELVVQATRPLPVC